MYHEGPVEGLDQDMGQPLSPQDVNSCSCFLFFRDVSFLTLNLAIPLNISFSLLRHTDFEVSLKVEDFPFLDHWSRVLSFLASFSFVSLTWECGGP